MKAKTNAVLIVVALLAYWIGLCNASAFYDPGTQRWLNRDPISEKGFYVASHQTEFQLTAKAYHFVGNDPIINIDAAGLWQVCCRPVRGIFGESLLTHCDVRPGPCDKDPGSKGYPISRDCNCSNPAIKSDADMNQCLTQNPSGWGHTCIGDNCQSSSLDVMKKCCAKAPGWTPNWYAYPLPIPPISPILPF